MAKDPAVLWYTNDFLAGTFTMSNEHVGMYTRLLCLQHQKGVLTEKDMLNICGTYVEDVFCKFEKKGSMYFNIKMKTEAEKRSAYSNSRKKNREKKDKDNNICESYEEHMENENANKDVLGFNCINGNQNQFSAKGFMPTIGSHGEMILSDVDVGSTIQFFQITLKRFLSERELAEYFEAFKIQNFTGKKYYESERDIVSHFRNWFKTNPLLKETNGNSKHQSKSERSAASANELLTDVLGRNAGLSTRESYPAG